MSGVRFQGRKLNTFFAGIISALFAQASFAASCVQSSHASWNNTSIAAERGSFTATFKATPNRADMDGLAGFSLNQATGLTSLAVIVRFNASGTIDVMNGAGYAASRSVPYSAGATYRIQMMINPVSHTYSVFVTPPGGSALAIASNYAFRNSQATTSKLNNWAVFADIGSVSACSLSITASSGSSGSGSATPPAITAAPSSQTVALGQTAMFSITATGTVPLTYQWKKNGTAVSGATSTSYTTPATTTADNGSQFTVVVSNSAGSITSAAATLTVTSSRAISWGPSSLSFGSVSVGTTKTLAVTISSTGTAATTISSDSISGSGFSAVGVPPLTGLILSPGQAATLNVTFAPSAAGTVSGSAIVSSNSSNSPTVTIPLSGTGAQTTTHSVSLSWDASTSSVRGYNVYRGTVSGGPYNKQNLSLASALSYTDSSVVAGDTYFYVVTAVNSANQESVYSNQVSAAIP